MPVDENQGFSSPTVGETNFESNTPRQFIPQQQHQQAHQSDVATLPYTRHLISLSTGDDDMTPRPIRESSTPWDDLIHTHPCPTHLSNFATLPNTIQGASLLSEVSKTKPIRQSDIPWDCIREKLQHSHPSNIAALPHARHVGSLNPQAVMTPGIPTSQGCTQQYTATRHIMPLPPLEPKQWNGPDDDQESLETIDDFDAAPQPDDPWKPPWFS
jgi:hypothetical protein